MSALAATIEPMRQGPAFRAAGLSGLRWHVVLASRPGADAKPAAATPAVLPSIDPADTADVGRSVEGDGDAYARLVHRHQPAIAAYMWRFTRNRTQWEELVQDVFVEAYLSLRSYRGRAPMVHWLRKIATRVGYRSWKKRSRLRIESGVPLEPWDRIAQPEQADPRQAAELVQSVLGRLGPRDRLVLTLFYLEEHSVAEIAELTGWSQTMVKVQAYRARNRLKKLLENEP